jgi:hypothetical protein
VAGGHASVVSERAMTSDALSSSGRQYFLQSRSAAWTAIAALILLALVLRLFGASGDLWLDEIWSLDLVGRLTSIDQVLWRVNHDNNHFLNSAWLYLTGPDASPLVQRALSILFGTATVLVAAAIVADRGRSAQLIAGLLFAISYPIVHYGSEARGYAGLVLFTLVATLCLQRRLDGRGSALALAAAILLGFLSHLTMLASVAVLVVWTVWVLLMQGRGPLRAGGGTMWIFLPAFLVVLPLAACIVIGERMFGVTFGGYTPYSIEAFATGYGGTIRYLFGLPSWVPDWLPIVVVFALVAFSAWRWPGRRVSLYVIGIVGLPILMMQARLPNLEFPRYFLVSGTLLLLWAAEMLGRGFDAPGWKRWAAAVVLAAIVAGSGLSLSRFYEAGRGSYASIVERITRDGPAAYASNKEFRARKVVDFFAARKGREARLVEAAEWCAQEPDWLIFEVRFEPPKPVETAPGCGLSYELLGGTRTWGLSGIAWALYRKRGGEPAAQVLSEFDALRLTPVMR